MQKLRDKWSLVTGSSRGIGQQIALGLAREGSNVILHGRKAENCAATLSLLEAYDVKKVVVEGELGEEGESRVIDAVLKSVGYVDVLYNNAAVMSAWHQRSFDIPLREWERIFSVNLYSMVMLVNAFVPNMIKRGWGRVINVSSGIKDTPQLAPYSVSKAAVVKYTQDLSAELKNTGVLVNALDPGWLKTDLGGEYAEHAVETVIPGALVPALLDDHGPSGRVFEAQDYRCLGSI